MIICADIGNSSTTLGILDSTDVKGFWRIITRDRTRDEYAVVISSFLEAVDADPAGISLGGVCSVVPSETEEVISAISSSLGIGAASVNAAQDCGIKILTDNPEEIGPDRIANAVGAYYVHHSPSIIVDVGTATTFDYVSGQGEYRGGIIAPGMVAGARDLWEKARRLPAVEIRKPPKLIGTNTVGSMQSGIFYGCLSQVEGILARMLDEITEECKVIVTGGQAPLIGDHLRFENTQDPYLTLKGVACVVDKELRADRRGAGQL
jgi:type III pantothenate kinase